MIAGSPPPASVRLLVLVALAGSLVPAVLWALGVGSSGLGLAGALDALFAADGSQEHLVVATVRLPRVLCALFVGATLAVAGALMQAVTGNPLASPGLLGINAGAAFAVVLVIVVLGTPPRAVHVWSAFAGAALAALAVYGLSALGPGGATPVRLVLSGAILTTFLAALTTALLLFDAGTLGAVRLWTAGSLAGAEPDSLRAVAPYGLAGLAVALAIAGQVATLSLGPDVSRSVGQNVPFWQAVCGLCVVALAGSAVALAGPIGFVGLVVPHMARLLVGRDERFVLPACALGGPLLVLVADTLLRVAHPGTDIPVGVALALVGAPLFIHLARTRLGGGAS